MYIKPKSYNFLICAQMIEKNLTLIQCGSMYKLIYILIFILISSAFVKIIWKLQVYEKFK
jgi:hypothetical protein